MSLLTLQMPALPNPVKVAVQPATTALLVFDMIDRICKSQPNCTGIMIPALASLLARARQAGLFVLYSTKDRRAPIGCRRSLPRPAAPAKMIITPASFSDREGLLIVAQNQGFFRRRNLDVQLVLMPNAPIAFSALAAGESHFYFGTTSGTSLGSVVNGLEGVFIAGFIHRLVGAFAVGKEVKTPRDLKANASAQRVWAAATGCSPCSPSTTGASSRNGTTLRFASSATPG